MKWFNGKNKNPVQMRGATSGNIIIPSAEGKLRVQARTKQGFIDVLCYYPPHFTSTLLSDRDVLRSSHFVKEYSGQAMIKYFELDDEKINKALAA